jgi:hypothetical protein
MFFPCCHVTRYKSETAEYKARANRNDLRYGAAHGRLPGPLEFFQPPVDSALTDYVPVSETLSGNYVFAASDVLAALSKSFAAEFIKM